MAKRFSIITVCGRFGHYLRSQAGNATMITALAAIPVIGSVGMAVDYMRATRSAQDLQLVADGAALAAAAAKNLTGTSSEILTKRTQIATNYINGASSKLTDIEIVGSPVVTPGPNTIDVSMNARVKGSFINVFNAVKDSNTVLGDGSAGNQAGAPASRDIDFTITAKAGFSDPSYLCLLALNAHQTNSIYFQGNSEFMATCAVQANSDATVAMKTWGNAEAYATSFCSLGGWSGSGFEPDPKRGCTFKTDPYATSLTLPTAGTCVTAAYLPGTTVGNSTQGITVKNTTAALKPGTYCGGLHVSVGGVANLAPGLYIIKGGTLDVTSGSAVNAQTGVVFYLTGANTYIDIKSGATFKVKAPTTATVVAATAWSRSTSTYKGMAVMQDRITSVGGTNSLYSKGGVNIEGAFYTPKQNLIVWANDTMNGTSKYFPMIVDTLNMNGTATLFVNLDYTAAGFAEPTELKNEGKVFVSQ